MSMRTEFEKENCNECPILFSGKYGCVPRKGKYHADCLLEYLETHTLPRSEALEKEKVRELMGECYDCDKVINQCGNCKLTLRDRMKSLKDLLDMVGVKQ